MTPAQNSGTTAGRMPVGRRFEKGVSGNPGGRPAGSKTYAIRQLVAEAFNDPNVWKEAVERYYRETLKTRKTVINGLEFAARVNREIGLGVESGPPKVTIIFESNIR